VSKERQMPEEEPLNLVPIMNLVTILIPVLLMAIKSLELSVIDTTLPAIGGAPSEDNALNDKPPLALKMAITNKGVRLLGADEYLYPGGRPQAAAGQEGPPDIPCKSNGVCTGLEDYDWNSLSQKLFDIKEKAKAEDRDSDSVVLLSESNIRYEILIGAMDASRAYKASDGQKSKLFPAVQIAGGSN